MKILLKKYELNSIEMFQIIIVFFGKLNVTFFAY